MINTPKTLLLQVLTMSPAGIGLSEKLQTNSRKNSLSRLCENQMSPKKTPFSSDGRRFFFWINHYFCSHVFECGEVVFFQGRIKWLLKGFDVHPKNVSFLQDQVGHFVQCEMPLYKRIYRLEVLDGQMAHSFKTLTSTGLPLDFGNLEKTWIWKGHLENLEFVDF